MLCWGNLKNADVFHIPTGCNMNLKDSLFLIFKSNTPTTTFSVSYTFKFNPHPYRMRLKSEGLSHELRKCPPDTFLPDLRSGCSFESHLEHKKSEIPEWVSQIFGAGVLIGLCRKVRCTNTFSTSDIFRFHPHPYRMRLKSEGLSHGLKTCHRHVFLTAFRAPPEH